MKKELLIGVCLSIIPAISNADPYTCAELGYVYIPEGCPSESFMARCPMNLDLVWCMDGEMCGKYPVRGDACHNGARVEICPQTATEVSQANMRCKYENESCNKCWSKGVYSSGTGCGTTESCCKEGWDWNAATGQCVVHECDPIQYPYSIEDNAYADYAGDVQTCKSGNTIHFGYKHGTCKSMWQHGSSNSRDAGYYKCLCQRENYEKGYIFPFDKTSFYTTFQGGSLGDFAMCSDAEGSYYGYTHCFRGWEMALNSGNKSGQCIPMESTYCNITYAHPGIPATYSEVTAIRNSNYRCIHDDKCTEENEKYEECNVCMADAGRDKSGKSIIKICSYLTSRYLGFKDGCYADDETFMGLITSGNYYGMCYRECEWGSKECRKYDVVKKNNIRIGMVLSVPNDTSRIILGFKPYTTRQWETAVQDVAAYTPSTEACSAGSGCEVGKWRLANSVSETNLMYGTPVYFIQGIFEYVAKYYTPGIGYRSTNVWSSYEKPDNPTMVYTVSHWDQGYLLKTLSGAVNPLLTMEVK